MGKTDNFKKKYNGLVDSSEFDSLRNKYSPEIAKYFGVTEDRNIKLLVFKDMRCIAMAFEKYTGKNAPTYLKGFSPGGEDWEEIWMVKPGAKDEFGKVMPKSRFEKTVKHEMVHTYEKIFAKANGTEDKNIPIWFREGLAIVLSDQNYFKDLDEISIDRIRTMEGLDPAKFSVGYKIVKSILKHYGKDKLLELYITKDQDKLYDELQRMFDWLK